jgi:hypothetical protein
MEGSVLSARRIRSLVGLSLVLAAAILVPLAFRERVTADFFVQVANNGWNGSADYKHAALESASSYTTLFWFDLALAAVLVVVATGVIRRAGPSLYGLAGLVAGFAASSGAWSLFGDQAELHGELPVGMLAVSLTIVATFAVLGSIAGWASTQPIGPRRPLSPPVPPSHQAG